MCFCADILFGLACHDFELNYYLFSFLFTCEVLKTIIIHRTEEKCCFSIYIEANLSLKGLFCDFFFFLAQFRSCVGRAPQISWFGLDLDPILVL